MPQVKSKYKNPDKYIQRLKADLEWEERRTDRLYKSLEKARGQHWFSYTDLDTSIIKLSTEMVGKARLAQDVLIRGRIVGYEYESDRNHKVTLELDSVHLKDKD